MKVSFHVTSSNKFCLLKLEIVQNYKNLTSIQERNTWLSWISLHYIDASKDENVLKNADILEKVKHVMFEV